MHWCSENTSQVLKKNLIKQVKCLMSDAHCLQSINQTGKNTLIPESEFLFGVESNLLVNPSAKLVHDPMAGFDPLADSQEFKIAVTQLNTKIVDIRN